MSNKNNIAAVVCIITLCAGIALTGLTTGFLRQSNGDNNLILEIEPGMTGGKIAEILKEKDVIRSVLIFTFISEAGGYSRSFKAGLHSLDKTMSMLGIARKLTENPMNPPDKIVMIIEGLTVNETASVLQEQAGIDSTEFVNLAMSKQAAQKLGVDNETLEGYLYPDTYFVKPNSSPMEMIERMVGQFTKVFDDSYRKRAAELGMTVREIVILASIIERETGFDDERHYISQVFHRRLKLGRPLQANPTIQYALGCRRRILEEDLTVDSAYNTYIYPGLPPGAISNPGKKSLLAALYPADSKYLYFVADGKGGNVFSHTLPQHNRAVRQYKRQRRQSSQR